MFDLMALAFEADLTRVFTFMLNREASQLVFPNLGFNEPWHHVSHHGNEPEKLALLVKLNTWQIEPVRQVPRAAAERRPTATARCSITRRSSGAAA